MKVGVRIDNKGRTGIRFFDSPADASEFLRSEGFYESYGVYRHLNQSVAGIFFPYSYNINDIKRLADNCVKPLKRNSVLQALIGR